MLQTKLSYRRPISLWFGLICFFTCMAVSVCSFANDDETESGDGKLAADKPVGASDEGELAMSSFRIPEGWKVSLFAAEPELANPVAMYVDNQGRAFVCESFRQDRGVTDNRKHDEEWLLADLSAESVQDRIDYHLRLLGTEANEYTAHDDRIRMLVDSDGDGVADQATLHASGFNKLEEGTGAGILVRGDKTYFTCIPKLWLLEDKNGDGQAEERKALHDGYGVRVAFRGHDSHGLIIGPDGRLYFSIGDRGYNIETANGTLKNAESGAVFRCELDGSNLEVFASGLRNPQELAFDDYGYLFTGDNNSDSGDKARWVNVMEGGDTGWRMMYQYLPDRGPFNREKIWHPYSAETPAYTVPPIENISDGPAGLTCYPGTGLTGDYNNCFFLVDFRGGAANSGIRLIRTQPKGAFWEIERSEQPIWNILATDADFGPDGRLWVCDWVFGWVGEGKGRIYRFEDTEAQQQDVVREVEALLKSGFADLADSKLGSLLTHVDRRIRLEAQWELATRGKTQEFAQLLVDTSAGTIPRLHCVWGLAQAARLNSGLRAAVTAELTKSLGDRDLDIRAASAAAVGDLRLNELVPQLIELIGDTEPRVQYAACLAAGKLHSDAALEPVCQMLVDNDNADPGLRHAGIMALKGMANVEKVHALSSHASESVRLAAVVALRKLNDAAVSRFLADASDAVVLEAARAIHDVPELHSALDALAAISIKDSASDALVHRVLNANFRLGGTQAASKIADAATSTSLSEAMRIEGIKMLGAWGSPGRLDRVMNRFLPLEDRSPEAAQLAFRSVFENALGASADIAAAAVETAVALQIDDVSDTLAALVLREESSTDLRVQALSASVELAGEGCIPLLKKLASDENVLVRATSIGELSKLDPKAAMPGLRKASKSENVLEAQIAWDALAGMKLGKKLVGAAVEDYLSGNIPNALRLNVREAIEARKNSDWDDSLEAHDQEAAQISAVKSYQDCIDGGDVELGETLFFTKTVLSCVRCHKVNGEGGEVGPDLSSIAAKKDREYLLESIVAPDAKIAEKFETIMLLTEDDQFITGILKSETASTLELINAEGEITFVESDVVVSRKQGKSAMPADLIKSLSKRELRDLVAYLASLKGGDIE